MRPMPEPNSFIKVPEPIIGPYITKMVKTNIKKKVAIIKVTMAMLYRVKKIDKTDLKLPFVYFFCYKRKLISSKSSCKN